MDSHVHIKDICISMRNPVYILKRKVNPINNTSLLSEPFSFFDREKQF